MDDRTAAQVALVKAEGYIRGLVQTLSDAALGARAAFGGDTWLGSAIIPTFVLRNGVPFTGRALPPHYKMRPPKQCFYNARMMARRSRVLVYHEGYCSSYDLPFPVHHAWVVGPGGLVDSTLEKSANYAYLGVPIPTEYLTTDKCWCGQFQTRYEAIDLDTLFRLDPGFREVLEKLKEGK